jgi:hypothetical protein
VNINSQGADKTIRPPDKGYLAAILIAIRGVVTDPSISAGETWGGAVSGVRLGAPARPKFYAGRDDLVNLVTLLNDGANTGQYLDAEPTTATAYEAYWYLPIGVDLVEEEDMELSIKIAAATQEWATATDMTGTVDILWVYLYPQERKGMKGARVLSRLNSSDTIHDVKCEDGLLGGLFMVAGTAGKVTKVVIGDYKSDNPFRLHQLYARLKKTAPSNFGSEVAYLAQPQVRTKSTHNIRVEASANTTLQSYLVYADN